VETARLGCALSNLLEIPVLFSVKVLDIGHNKLLNVSVKNVISSPIRLFDMTMNSQLKINEQDYDTIRCRMCWFC